MGALRRVAYAAMGVPFVILGYQSATTPGRRVDAVAELGLPEPEKLVVFNGRAMMAGGTALAVGVLPRLAAAGLALSLIPTTLAGHAFWKHDDPAARATQRVQLLKNATMFGGLVLVAITPRRRRRRGGPRAPRPAGRTRRG